MKGDGLDVKGEKSNEELKNIKNAVLRDDNTFALTNFFYLCIAFCVRMRKHRGI